jgi:type 1 glutamine amidotransferase
MRKLTLVFLLLAIPFTRLARQTAPPKIQTLLITGQQGGHDWKAVSPELRKVLEVTGRFEVRITEEFRGAGPETLAPYDLVVLNYQDRQPSQRWGDRADKALLDFVRSGKGVVMFHFAVAAFAGWEEYEKMSGGNWRPAGTDHILATACEDHAFFQGEARQPIPGPGLNQPILWTLSYGQGRVFADMLGHDVAAVNTVGAATVFARGAEWAATGAVTLPIPPEMRQ